MRFGTNRDTEQAAATLRDAFDVLVGPQSRDCPESGPILINMLQYIRQMINGDRTPMERKFALLEICEHVLQSIWVPEAVRQIIRKIRSDLAQVWELECEVRADKKEYVGWR